MINAENEKYYLGIDIGSVSISLVLINQKKQGISFDEAKTVFYDDSARLIYDPDHSDTEDRFVLLGLSINFRILTVIHTYQKNEK